MQARLTCASTWIVYPDIVYLSEISRKIDIQETNIKGCLSGLTAKGGNKYSYELSLISPGLVEGIVKGGK